MSNDFTTKIRLPIETIAFHDVREDILIFHHGAAFTTKYQDYTKLMFA